MVTGVPTSTVPESHPLVSVASPVPPQWAAWPRNTRSPLVNTKLLVQDPPPSVSVTTPGWIGAEPAGAHPAPDRAGAAVAAGASTAPSAIPPSATANATPRALTVIP